MPCASFARMLLLAYATCMCQVHIVAYHEVLTLKLVLSGVLSIRSLIKVIKLIRFLCHVDAAADVFKIEHISRLCCKAVSKIMHMKLHAAHLLKDKAPHVPQ